MITPLSSYLPLSANVTNRSSNGADTQVAALKSQLAALQKALDAAEKSAKTPEGDQNIQSLNQQIAALQMQIAQLKALQEQNATKTPDTTASQGGVSTDANGPLGVHLNVYAFPRLH